MGIASTSQKNFQEDLRTTVQLNTHPEHVQNMLPDELAALQSKLGYGEEYGVWTTPREWLPAGSRRQSILRINFHDRLTYCGVPTQLIDDTVLYLTRYAVLLALCPSGVGRLKNRQLKPHSISVLIYKTIPPLIAITSVRSKNKNDYFNALRDEDFEAFATSKKDEVRRELARIHMLCDQSLWSDRPSIGTIQKDENFSPDVKGSDVRPKTESKPEKFKPLPDDWVAEAGWRVLWIVRELGPNLVTLGRKLAEITQDEPFLDSGVSNTRIQQRRRARAIPLIATHRWINPQGQAIVMPPFPLTVTSGRTTPKLLPGQWPPTQVAQILTLLHLLQYSHLFVVLLSMASRISEVLSLQSEATSTSSDGTPFANGLTFKLTQHHDGLKRDWPLPNIALEVIHQQEDLHKILTMIGGWANESKDYEHNNADSLWLNYGAIDELCTTGASDKLRKLATSINLTTTPGGQNLSSHRFRKTIARLVALAVTGAPKILMDLFGHKSIEMTLDYILTDPDITAEVKNISEEMVVMRAVTAIENIDDYGGRAAKSIIRMKEHERHRLGRNLGAADVRGLAEILTMNGQFWELSRPGIICTKLPGSYGECAKKVGHPEPSHCGSACDYRLEEAFLRKDVDGAIAESIQHYEAERNIGNSLMQDFWAGQVLTHLNRFDNLREKWAIHQSVHEILSREEITE